MKISDIKIGDVVTLKSGGPPMSVKRIDLDEKAPIVYCEWFTDNKQVAGWEFHPSTLMPYKS